MASSNPLPISVIVRTLDEEANIEACLRHCLAANPLEVIVVDGGSHDATCRIAERLAGVKLVHAEKGLALQRDAGILAALPESVYIAIVDADDRLDSDCLVRLLADLEAAGAVAAQAKHDSVSRFLGRELTYWEQAMLVNLKIIRDFDRRRSTPIIMVGRPALYQKRALLDAIRVDASQYTRAAEDADLSYTLIRNGGRFTIGTGITYRKHLDTFSKVCRRWLAYGSGDATFICAHPERAPHVIYHVLVTYPVKRALYCAARYHLKYSPFFILQGIIRFIGLSAFFLRNCIPERQPAKHTV